MSCSGTQHGSSEEFKLGTSAIIPSTCSYCGLTMKKLLSSADIYFYMLEQEEQQTTSFSLKYILFFY